MRLPEEFLDLSSQTHFPPWTAVWPGSSHSVLFYQLLLRPPQETQSSVTSPLLCHLPGVGQSLQVFVFSLTSPWLETVYWCRYDK